MPTPVVLLDANVLVPLSLRDTLLRAAEQEVFRVRWTEQILEETRRTLVGKRFMAANKATELLDALRDAFPDALITGYEPAITQMTNHLDDRHVTAAAWHAHADAIVTFNLRHFPQAALAPLNLRALHPDAFLLECFAVSPDVMAEIIRRQAQERTRPAQTVVQVLERLAKLAPHFAASIREQLDR